MNKPVKKLIRVWMAENELTSEDIALQMGKSASSVRRFYSGSMSSEPMRKWFLDKGCPPEAFGLDDETSK